MLKARYLILLLPFILGACAVPIPIQLAGWFLDGLSFLSTDKTISDHGISVVMGQDCALFRTMTEGELCRPDADDRTAVAALDRTLAAPAMHGDSGKFPEIDPAISALAAFETAVGPSVGSTLPTPPEDIPIALASPTVVDDRDSTRVRGKVGVNIPASSLYYSLGSFKTERQAQKSADLRPNFTPSVMTAEIDGKTVYRVVVGPVKPEDRSAMKRKIAATGIHDAWAFTQVAEAR